MFLNAVILILQEILEGALLIAVLMGLNRVFVRLWPNYGNLSWSWVGYSLLLGGFGGWLYAWATPTVSEWFDYVGQEVVNALLHGFSLLGILVLCFLAPMHLASTRRRLPITQLALMFVVMLAFVREGSEIIIYLAGVTAQHENVTSVLLGASIGAGIGLSCGVFLYYSLSSVKAVWSLRACLVLLALISGNMASQIVMLLSQADWLPYTPTAWDSSALLSESSIPGHLLYALVGYESNPSILQAVCYFLGMAVLLPSPLFRRAWLTSPETNLYAQV